MDQTYYIDEVTTLNKLKPKVVCIVTYRCRDLGYDVERGTVRASWTGDVDIWGKHTIKVVSGRRRTIYLFADEIQRVRINVLV